MLLSGPRRNNSSSLLHYKSRPIRCYAGHVSRWWWWWLMKSQLQSFAAAEWLQFSIALYLESEQRNSCANSLIILFDRYLIRFASDQSSEVRSSSSSSWSASVLCCFCIRSHLISLNRSTAIKPLPLHSDLSLSLSFSTLSLALWCGVARKVHKTFILCPRKNCSSCDLELFKMTK